MSNFVVPGQDPMDELRRWIAEATNAGISNSAAMVLATVDRRGQPSARALMAGTRDESLFFHITRVQKEETSRTTPRRKGCSYGLHWNVR